MNGISRINRKIIDYLLKMRKVDPTFFFATRQRNTKERLDKGYWFLGNEKYVHISFWVGSDWKEKIFNIGFVVLNDRTSYIELSAQDSAEKGAILEEIAKVLGNFIANPSKRKWHREYESKEYLKNLKHFLKNEKPIIDKIIHRSNDPELRILEKSEFEEKYYPIVKRRESQLKYGEKNKLVRICWNSNFWKYPSGANGKSSLVESHEYQFKFGFEEWLFNKTRTIDGWNYGFLEALRLKTGKHHGKKYNISLYCTHSDGRLFYVGRILNAECVSFNESEKIFSYYKNSGWLNKMEEEVLNVGGDWKSSFLTDPKDMFNVKFRHQDCHILSDLELISNEDLNITTLRYQLLDMSVPIAILEEESTRYLGTNEKNGQSKGNKKNTKRRKRIFKGESEYDPYHDIMQNKLFDYLEKDENYEFVQIEKDWVDLKGYAKNGEVHFFEIKTDSPKRCIRQGLGQILEYSYYPEKNEADKLFIVGDSEPSENDKLYLQHLRELLSVPIFYYHFDPEKENLSEQY